MLGPCWPRVGKLRPSSQGPYPMLAAVAIFMAASTGNDGDTVTGSGGPQAASGLGGTDRPQASPGGLEKKKGYTVQSCVLFLYQTSLGFPYGASLNRNSWFRSWKIVLFTAQYFLNVSAVKRYKSTFPLNFNKAKKLFNMSAPDLLFPSFSTSFLPFHTQYLKSPITSRRTHFTSRLQGGNNKYMTSFSDRLLPGLFSRLPTMPSTLFKKGRTTGHSKKIC